MPISNQAADVKRIRDRLFGLAPRTKEACQAKRSLIGTFGKLALKRKFAFLAIFSSLTACGGSASLNRVEPGPTEIVGDEYIIGPGDVLQVFVWGHEDLTSVVQVRPDGRISTPLVEDMRAAGKAPSELARDLEVSLSEYVRSPRATVIVQQFVGEYSRQIRVVGQAAQPQALSYRDGMTLLDVMIEVGGLAEFASGNKARIVRVVDGKEIAIKVRINDLLNKGDLSQNIRMMPGDILVIPESFF